MAIHSLPHCFLVPDRPRYPYPAEHNELPPRDSPGQSRTRRLPVSSLPRRRSSCALPACVGGYSASGILVRPNPMHPHSQNPSVLGIPFSYYLGNLL